MDQSSKDINQPASAFSAPFFPKSILKKTVPETGNNPNDTRDSCGSDGDNDGDDDSDGSDESDDSDEAGDSRGQDGSNGDGGSGDQVNKYKRQETPDISSIWIWIYMTGTDAPALPW